ncbi:GNAT family N-acetyltransferase [Paraglaciecola sp. L1A13]|uniref:GNAT family N-acetyltransferase n=1 Tax=Paraglaciecola sp. L1A13 TaxID=2686359 RepID=UPI00131EC6ED|nr:GNAT family N-acetyltransferase [Paraglaciecola sp. L1A13]|tara:strand:- start:14465 stop:14914 length:450 start_codon:yes stop_codon:yes gene_type:complete
MQTTIRKAQVSDINALVNFNQLMAKETEDMELDSDILTLGVSNLINDVSKGFYLVAEVDSQVVGSLMVTTEWSDWRNSEFWWIQSVYIVPKFRRKGLYSALYNEVKSLGDKAQNVCGYRLYVERENRVAQRTYEALDMDESHYLMYEGK